MSKTKIEWTEYSWNFITGCNKISPGCRNCYAETIAKRFWKDRKFTDILIDESKLDLPHHLKKPRMIFVNSMSDLFHERIPAVILNRAFDVMLQTNHTYQILTKRPERMLEHLKLTNVGLSKNIWFGVSVENQKAANERIPILLQTPAAIRWLSVEPLLEPIAFELLEGINWVVIGAESGHNRRECKIEWVEDIIDQCKQAHVPVFVKQLSIDGKVVKDISLFPKHLQIREYPKNF